MGGDEIAYRQEDAPQYISWRYQLHRSLLDIA